MERIEYADKRNKKRTYPSKLFFYRISLQGNQGLTSTLNNEHLPLRSDQPIASDYQCCDPFLTNQFLQKYIMAGK